jgi:23S rRNA G2445 N2-methylase RlmL
MRYFATAIPGLHPVLAREIEARRGARAAPLREFDGRNDVVSFTARGSGGLIGLRTAEDVFAEVSSVHGQERLGAVVGGLWNQQGLERALSAYAGVHPLRARMTFRVVARVRSEQRFLRTELRDELVRRVLQTRSRWRLADPADLELWVLETSPSQFRLGIRLSSASMRHRTGRPTERPGALRPTVAAAMAYLAHASSPGQPAGPSDPAPEPGDPAPGPSDPAPESGNPAPGSGKVAGEVLLDPCCGTGTVLAEAAAQGRDPVGGDLDPAAIEATRQNLGRTARHFRADVRRLPLAGASVAAVASNLPFGRRYELQGDPERWFAATLGELARVTRPDGSIVLLVPRSPAFERALARQPAIRSTDRLDLRLLGMTTALWTFRRL